jgi:hypothetical protein
MSGGFSKDDDWDYELRVALGEARSGATDPGEVLAAIDGLHPGDAAGWKQAWVGLGRRVLADAKSSHDAGRRESAASAYLRGASYLARGVNAAAAEADDADLLPLFREHRGAWEAFLADSELSVERLDIPLDGRAMPAWPLASATKGDGPVLIGVNGSDGALTSMWSAIAKPALDRGYRVLLFDGPGQQSMLFEQGIPFRADWGPVLTAVVDMLVARPDVDAGRLVGYAISQGGYWLPQALATEHRLAAAIADPGVVQVSTSWTGHLPGSLMKAFHEGKQHDFDRDMELGMRFSAGTARTWRFRARPFLADGPFATLTAVMAYDGRDVLPRVTTPLFVADPEDEQFWPGQSGELARLVPSATLVPFTAAEGANFHCEPLGRAVFEQRAFDWLAEVLP